MGKEKKENDVDETQRTRGIRSPKDTRKILLWYSCNALIVYYYNYFRSSSGRNGSVNTPRLLCMSKQTTCCSSIAAPCLPFTQHYSAAVTLMHKLPDPGTQDKGGGD